MDNENPILIFISNIIIYLHSTSGKTLLAIAIIVGFLFWYFNILDKKKYALIVWIGAPIVFVVSWLIGKVLGIF